MRTAEIYIKGKKIKTHTSYSEISFFRVGIVREGFCHRKNLDRRSQFYSSESSAHPVDTNGKNDAIRSVHRHEMPKLTISASSRLYSKYA